MLMVAGWQRDCKDTFYDLFANPCKCIMEGKMKKLPVIIPARAGSKGIIGKNIVTFCERPLISWSIIQALESEHVSGVYVSTDGEDIAAVSEKAGASIIWRPSELASDTSSSEDALRHAIREIENEEEFESLIFLQATSPIRRADDIDKAVEFFLEGGYDSIFSMAVLEDFCMWKRKGDLLFSYSYDYKNRGRRQDREPIYLENGSIYIFKKNMFLEENNRLGGKIGMYEMPFECSYEIDSLKDVKICEFFMKNMIIDQNY